MTAQRLTPEQESRYNLIRYECLLRGIKLLPTGTCTVESGNIECFVWDNGRYVHPIIVFRESLDHPDECIEVIVEFAKANRTYYKRAEMARWN